MAQQEKIRLKKAFRPTDVFSLAFGTMVGWGWVILSGNWAKTAGTFGAIAAFAIGAVLCIFIGLTYAELTPMLPRAGGSVHYSITAMGRGAAVFAGLSTVFAYLSVAAWEGPAFASAINYLVPIPQKGYLWTVEGFSVYLPWLAVAVAVSVLLIYINIRGAKLVAKFQTVATVGKILAGVLFVIGALLFGSLDHMEAGFTDLGGFSTVLLAVPTMFVGFDVIPQSSGEMDVPLKKIPGLLIASILAGAGWYMLMILGISLAAPASVWQSSEIPVADAMAYCFGHPVWGKFLIIGGLCGVITGWNGCLYGAARCLFSMGRYGLLPAAFGKLHPKYQTPYVAVLFCGILATGCCLLGTGALNWFVNAGALGVVLMYLMSVLSFLVLRKKRPELERPFRLAHPWLVGILALVISVLFICLYLPFGPSSLNSIEWGMVLGWYLLGALAAVCCQPKKRKD